MSARLLGGALLLLAGTLLGCAAAGRLDGDAKRIRLLRQLVSAAVTELRGTLPVIPDLLRDLARMPQFLSLTFLQQAAAHAGEFPSCWQRAIAEDPSLSDGERAVLETVGQTLGSTTLEGQTAALSLCGERLAALQAEAESRAKQQGNLLRSMGVLGSMFLVILLL